MVILVAVLNAVEGKGDLLEQECKKMIPKVMEEPGALVYTVHRAVDNPDKFMIYEQYESQESFQAHGQTEHFKAFVQATQDIVGEGGEMTFYNKVA